MIYDKIFTNTDKFLEQLYDDAFSDEDLFDEKEKVFNQVKGVIEKYYRVYGRSVKDRVLLQKARLES